MKNQKQSLHQQSAEKLKALLDQKTAELDLKNRELEVEAALECVRSRSMAMHESSELQEVIGVLYDQLNQLGLQMDAAQIDIYEKGSEELNVWVANELQPYGRRINIPHFDHPMILDYLKARNEGLAEFSATYSKEDKNSFYAVAFKNSDLKDILEERKEKMLAGAGLGIYAAFVGQTSIQLLNFDGKEYDIEECRIVKRFAEVFQQTYTRFLDLQKAEAQAREAQIEAALERVRARAMGLHKSDELKEVIAILYNQLKQLGIELYDANIVIQDKSTNALNFWGSGLGGVEMPPKITIPFLDRVVLKKLYYERDSLEKYRAFELKGKELKNYHKIIMTETEFKDAPKEYQEEMLSVNPVVLSHVLIEHGLLEVASDEFLSKDHAEILQRFGSVVDLTYTRFADLQKAEAQARAAQIEAVLERIRARALAMHSSDELIEVANVLRDQMASLGQPELESCLVTIFSDNSETIESWYAFRPPNDSTGKIITGFAKVSKDSSEWAREAIAKYKSPETEYTIVASGNKLKEWYEVLAEVSPATVSYDDKGKMLVPEILYYHFSNFSGGSLLMISEQKPSVETKELQCRAAKVFDLAYRRFLDLQKAEAQAREAQIEAALERIRSKALAMQSSSDLLDVSIVLREQMGNLGQQELESSIVHLYNNTESLEAWYTFRSTETNSTKIVTDKAIIPVNSCEYIKETIEKYNSKESEYTIVSKGKKLTDWYNVMVKVASDTIEYDDDGKMIVPDILYYHHSKFSGGALIMISNEKPSNEAKELQKRAAKVFNLAYQRFLDLQHAEARTKETIKQASLDRVRGEIASMRSKDDLNRITPLIWQELTTLSVPFIRCGVFIMDEESQIIQSHLSSPDGNSLGLLNLPYDADNVTNNAVNFWRKGEIYQDHWNQDQFKKFMKKMVKLGRLDNPELYQGAAKPPESLDLHFVPFKQGMLYVGNTAPLSQGELQLVQSLAEAFSIAYARYEDFTQLEEAKNQTEQTLDELKSTQSQLIHAEKMASLGELTAGIAHEIQNPLNFVNNFAEVSADLIEEMHEEMESGNTEEVKAITNDIKQNLQKIHHHGSRASSIVKGMLEHSRTSTGKKELTDINILADEYLRLAYYGLRAKDKTFNADFKTEFDETIPKIHVIAQDIGRVLLNLINNAFFAVSNKTKKGIESYTPSIIISTKKNKNTLVITVKDNGDGIPADIRDKIFQPFFTTKPTGQGTGLGLSLSYDIITKGHDGHLEVETEEGMGTRFIVQLPNV